MSRLWLSVGVSVGVSAGALVSNWAGTGVLVQALLTAPVMVTASLAVAASPAVGAKSGESGKAARPTKRRSDKTDPVREKPPILALAELELRTRPAPGTPAINRRVRVAYPKDWTQEPENDGRSVRLFGPNGEGTILIAATLQPAGLNEYLSELKANHPAVAPSPPIPMDLPGIRPELGERATRFVIQGQEMGEMVMVERGETIVLIVTIVDPAAWPSVSKLMARCYPTVEVADVRDGP